MGLPETLGGEVSKRALENGRKDEEDYPMDFYADGSLGEWTPRFGMVVRKAGGERGRPVPKSRRKKVDGEGVAKTATTTTLPPPVPTVAVA